MDERYSRQVLFSKIGAAGQEKLGRARILIAGCGALGASHAEMLARAGVGFLRIIDRDFVEYTNLQRQTLFAEEDAEHRTPKAVAAARRIRDINSGIKVESIVTDINHSNIESMLDDCDVVIDGTDNFQVRYLLNDACVKLGRPWIYGAAVSSYGTTMTVVPGETPCLRCIFEELPDAGSAPTCETAGVIMPIITSISSIQVAEAIKFVVGDGEAMHRSLIQIDLWKNDWRTVALGSPEPDCVCCGSHNFEFLNAEVSEFSAVLCGRHAVQIAPSSLVEIDLDRFADRIKFITPVNQNEYLVRFTVDDLEVTVFSDGRAIIKGTEDVSVARSIYSKYVGT